MGIGKIYDSERQIQSDSVRSQGSIDKEEEGKKAA